MDNNETTSDNTKKDENPYEQLLATIKEQQVKINALEKKVDDVTKFNQALLHQNSVVQHTPEQSFEDNAKIKLEEFLKEKN